MATGATTIIVKKIKKGHGGHHGGAWKVAYADFVTAMMAFFLLLWLLNATTQEQRSGISDYFAPASVSRSTSGSGGLMGGLTITLDGPARGKGAPIGMPSSSPPEVEKSDADEESDDKVDRGTKDEHADDADGEGKVKDSKAKDGDSGTGEDSSEAFLRQLEDRKFRKAETAIKKRIEAIPGLSALGNNLVFDHTEHGLRIQLIDSHPINTPARFLKWLARPLPNCQTKYLFLAIRILFLTPGVPVIAIGNYPLIVPMPAAGHWSVMGSTNPASPMLRGRPKQSLC